MQKYLNEEQLKEVTKLAALCFTPREIAIMLELPAADFIQECEIEGSDCYNAFYSGRLQSEVDLRTSIFKLAKSGSSPAQTMAMDMMKQSKAKMLDK